MLTGTVGRTYFPEQILIQEHLYRILKPAALLTALAAATLSSMALAYYAPQKWMIAAIGLCGVQAFSLPSLFKQENIPLIRKLLTISLIGMGCLALGGLGAASYHSISRFQLALNALTISAALSEACLITGFAGYGLPFCQSIFEKGYSLLQHPVWEEKLTVLKGNLQQLDFDKGYGFFNRTFQSSLMAAHLAASPLIQICLISCCLIFRIDIAPSLLMINANSKAAGSERLKELVQRLTFLNSLIDTLSISVPDNVRMVIHNQLVEALSPINQEEDLEEAFNSILQDVLPLVPNWQSPEQFIGLFQNKFLDLSNVKIEAFIQSIEGETSVIPVIERDCLALKQRLNELERVQIPQMESLARLHSLQADWNRLKNEIRVLHLAKRSWQKLFDLLCLVEQPLLNRFHLHERILNFNAANAQKFQKMHEISRLLTIVSESSIVHRFQCLAARLEIEKEETPAWIFLGAERCSFVMEDYEEMKEWLHLGSLNDLEGKFNELGLVAEEHLYEKGIVPRNEAVTKQQIKANLKRYIDEKLIGERKWDQRLRKAIRHIRDLPFPIRFLAEKVVQFVYNAFLSGLILIPVILHPVATSLGFIAGGTVVAMKRFSHFEEGEGDEAFLLKSMAALLCQLNLSSFAFSQFNQDNFAQGKWSTRARLINVSLLIANSGPFASFSQGIELARALSHLI